MNPRELIAEVFEHIRGMWRYRWLTAVCAWCFALVGWTYVYSIPNIYRASTKVFVDTSSLIRPLMQGLTAVTDTMNEVQLVSRAVLTRPNLERVAYETDLALRAETPEEMELLITGLQSRIIVSGGRDNIFSIQYEDASRDDARAVVAAVLDTFVENAIGNSGDDADVTERAISNEIEVHERRLREAEESLAKFKQENLGYMPGEYGDYYMRLQTALDKVSETEEKLRQITERRDELRRQIEGEDPVFGIVPTTGANSNCARSAQIAGLQKQLDELSVNFTAKHPRIVTLEETIAQLQQECEAEVAARPATSPSVDGRLEVNPVFQNLRIQLSSAEVELAELRSRAAAEQREVQTLRRDVDKITEVETQLKQLNRDYNVVQGRHQELLRRWEDLQAKRRLDPVTDNVRYRRIEPPFAEADPVGPNRLVLLAAVLVGALGGALALAFSLNQLNPVFFTRRSIMRVTALPVLGSISMVASPSELRRSRLQAAVWGAAMLLLLAAAAASVVFAPQATALVQALLGGGS